MKNLFNYISAGLVAIAMVAGSADLNAQSRASRSSSSSSTSQQRSSSSSSTRSTSATRSSSASNNRSSASANRSSSASNNRSSATVNRSTSSSSTRSATPQVNRNSRTEATQNRNSRTEATQSRNSQSSSNSRTQATQSRQARDNAAAARNESTTPQVNRNSRTEATQSNNSSRTSASQSRTSRDNAAAARSNSSSSKGLNTVSGNGRTSRSNENINMSAQNLNNMKMDDKRNISRVAPVQRDRIQYNQPDHFFNPGNHYFGYGVHQLPPHYSHMNHWGVDYYFHNDIYYRRHGNIYVVCRPPFGVTFSRSLRRMQFATVRFAYYYNVNRAFNVIDDNYRTIMEQNRIIAANNARIAQQNVSIALNSDRAYSAHNVANALGLVQSYAGIDSDYFYDDGIFYAVNSRGRYEVIVPPAGALVDELPDDYDIITLNGIEYYRVDDTVYRLTLVDGTPLLEVLGQMPYRMASRYWN